MSTLIKTADGWKEVANLSSSDVVRNPDWSRAVSILTLTSPATNEYLIPEDGIITGYTYSADTDINDLTVNGIRVARSDGFNMPRVASVQCPVATGDIVKITASTKAITFVPYRVQKSQEESHAIINIQNLVTQGTSIVPWNSSEFSSIARFTFPKKGIYFCAVHITIASITSQGIAIRQPYYSCGHANNVTHDSTFIVNATTDNYVCDIKATANHNETEVVNTYAIQGQAIKLY